MLTSKRWLYQRGISSIEFSALATVLFLLLFAVLEFGRWMFVWNVLDEVTRRGARLAAVCPVTQTTSVQNQAVFGGALVPGLTAANVSIQYLDQTGALIVDPISNFTDISFVRARIVNYQHQLLVPLLASTFMAPPFTTTVPSESLGVHPTAAGAANCN